MVHNTQQQNSANPNPLWKEAVHMVGKQLCEVVQDKDWGHDCSFRWKMVLLFGWWEHTRWFNGTSLAISIVLLNLRGYNSLIVNKCRAFGIRMINANETNIKQTLSVLISFNQFFNQFFTCRVQRMASRQIRISQNPWWISEYEAGGAIGNDVGRW